MLFTSELRGAGTIAGVCEKEEARVREEKHRSWQQMKGEFIEFSINYCVTSQSVPFCGNENSLVECISDEHILIELLYFNQ